MKRTKTGLKISNGVIKLSFRNDDVSVKAIEKRLGDMWPAAKKITRWVLNDTAKKARSLLFQNAKKSYTIKTATFNRTTKLKKATKKKEQQDLKFIRLKLCVQTAQSSL